MHETAVYFCINCARTRAPNGVRHFRAVGMTNHYFRRFDLLLLHCRRHFRNFRLFFTVFPHTLPPVRLRLPPSRARRPRETRESLVFCPARSLWIEDRHNDISETFSNLIYSMSTDNRPCGSPAPARLSTRPEHKLHLHRVTRNSLVRPIGIGRPP